MTISIITPSYNQGQFIERTLQSVLTQPIPLKEYVVFDAVSTDNTLDILKKYSTQLKWISEKDKGQTDAVNKGIQLTTGDIIGWLNSDDIYYPDALKTVSDFFRDHPDVDVVYGNANHIDSEDRILEPYYTESWSIDRLKEVCYLCQPAVFFRRSVVDRFGLLNEDLQYCMDYEYWLRIARKGAKFAYIPKVLAGSRLHADTKTLGSRVKVHEEINDMLKQTLNRVPNRWLCNYAHAIVESQNNHGNVKRAIAVQTIRAAFRWNRWISPRLLRLCLIWIISSLKQRDPST